MMAVSSSLRHCAFCVKELSGTDVKLCGGCRRRAYCSKECQATDWKPNGGGQGHKNWCALNCGEEDLDWCVAPVPGKGLGLVAKRSILPLTRIMVEGPRANSFPAVQELMPHGGSASEKYALNTLGNGDGTSSLCLRISRANHDCSGNAAHYWDPTYKVKVLFSEREIREDEEICFSYTPHNDISGRMSFASSRLLLQQKWGIECPPTCICYDAARDTLMLECSKLDEKIMSLASNRPEIALDCAKRLLKLEDENGLPWMVRHRTLYDAFQVAILKRKTLALGKSYMQKCCDIIKCVHHPESKKCREYKELIERPQSHRNYLLLD